MEPPASVRLVGRAAELGELEAELRRAAAGELRCLLLLADAGIGKTRLAAELLSRHRRETVGLRARAHPFGAAASFGLWVEALEGHLRTLEPAVVRELCGGFTEDLASLLPSVAAVSGAPNADRPERLRLLTGLTVLVDNIARTTPVIVVLDDAHLSDASSWEALNYVARTLPDARVLLLVMARPGELAGQQVPNEVVLALEQEGLLRRITVRALGHDKVRELARLTMNRPPADTLVDWLYTRSRGIPLFAIGLLRALIEEGGDLAAPRLKRLPEDLSERITVRLGQLPDLERAVLEALALLGRRTEASDLTGITGRSLDELAPALDRLVVLRLVGEDEQPGAVRYEIAHPLIQEAIYQGIGAARRRALHRLAARMLMESGRLADAAPHFVRSARLGDTEAIDALISAVRQAESRGLYREALPTLEALLQLLPSGDRRWLQVVDVMARQADWVIDHMGDTFALIGLRAMREIERVVEGSSDLHLQGLVQLRLASFLAWGTSDLPEARQAAERAVALFENAGDRQLTLLAANERAWIIGLAGDLAGQEKAASKVVQDAAAANETVPRMQALGNLGRAALLSGRFAVAEDALERSIAIAREEGRRYRLSWNLSALAWSRALGGQVADAQSLLEEAKRANPDYRESLVLEIGAHVQWMAGDFDGCVSTALESAAWHADHPSRRRAAAMAIAAMAAAEMGQLTRARAYLDVALNVFGNREWYWASHFCGWAEGVLASRGGSVDIAMPALQTASDRLQAIGALPYAAFVLLDLVEAAVKVSESRLAERAAIQIQSIARQVDRYPYQALAALAKAEISLNSGLTHTAVDPARQAVALLENSEYAAYRGRALKALGRALGQSDRPAATAALERAISAFVSCGAAQRRDECLAVLSELGHRGRRAIGATLGPGALTRREREVARLAAEGQTSQLIAKQLFISERTVETHLENAYAKLGVASKLELVRRAPELKL